MSFPGSHQRSDGEYGPGGTILDKNHHKRLGPGVEGEWTKEMLPDPGEPGVASHLYVAQWFAFAKRV